MKPRVILLVLLAVTTMTSTVAGERILFATDRGVGFEAYKMGSQGEPPPAAAVTDESGNVVSTSITPSGRDVVYEVNGTLYLNDVVNPVGTPIALGAGQDPNTSPSYINTDRDYRVLYVYQDSNGVSQIAMGTVDISDDPLVLSDIVAMTANPPFPQGGWYIDHTEPAFCGDDHFVWTKDDTYETELCIQQFDANGPVGSPSCYWGGYGDAPDHHPSCASTGLFMTWARGGPGYGDGSADIWIMPCDGTDCDTAPGMAKKLYGTHYDETQPVWNPGDTWVGFAQRDENWDLWKIEVEQPVNLKQLTTHLDDDTAPSWGP